MMNGGKVSLFQSMSSIPFIEAFPCLEIQGLPEKICAPHIRETGLGAKDLS
jgi:hypothetical protein